MIRYTSTKQIEIFTRRDGLPEFEHPFQTELDPENRWVKLSKVLPWDELVEIYGRSLSKTKGKQSVDGRLAVGSLIIKHKQGISDREVIEQLKENIYLQYFAGFKGFKKESAFDASLFVELRKRMGSDEFDEMSRKIIDKSEEVEKSQNAKSKLKNAESEKDKGSSGGSGLSRIKSEESKAGAEEPNEDQSNLPRAEKDYHLAKTTGEENKTEAESKQTPANKGKLKIDATVSDQMIVYPTDVGLLNRAREESERIIDFLYKESGIKTKPRTYRREARKAYLSVSKKKNKTKNEIRKAVGKQSRFLSGGHKAYPQIT